MPKQEANQPPILQSVLMSWSWGWEAVHGASCFALDHPQTCHPGYLLLGVAAGGRNVAEPGASSTLQAPLCAHPHPSAELGRGFSPPGSPPMAANQPYSQIQKQTWQDTETKSLPVTDDWNQNYSERSNLSICEVSNRNVVFENKDGECYFFLNYHLSRLTVIITFS